MITGSQWKDKIFNVTAAGFTELALEVFHFQYRKNNIYRSYVDGLGIDRRQVKDLSEIPFLPINFFKSHEVKTTSFIAQEIFVSSGTTGDATSRHFIYDISIYEESFTRGFESFYGPVNSYCIIGLLPSYLERNNSSLVYMVDKLIKRSGHQFSGFYLEDHKRLVGVLKELEEQKQKTILLGVSFALLDLAEKYPVKLKHSIIMETGGMKGRRREMIREELHEILKKAFSVPSIHSEYGMTELLSQAYSKGEGIFHTPAWMKMLVRDEEDPLTIKKVGPGILNIIDLANLFSCSFIATDDVGKINELGSFEVLGRIDNTDLRGCSLLVS
jgi:phenylacetate-coenzyme A ligase PaaK-like adenylate-forming protein